MSADTPEGLPIVPHIAGEFYAWLWWTSEQHGSSFDLGAPVGVIDVWVDERLAFRNQEETKVSAVMTGDNPSASLEARAALAGGKVLQEIRLGIRREDREFFVTLKGPAMHLTGLKLPQVVTDGDAEVVFERIHLYDEVCFVLSTLLKRFAEVRSDARWQSEVVPGLHAWLLGRFDPVERDDEDLDEDDEDLDDDEDDEDLDDDDDDEDLDSMLLAEDDGSSDGVAADP